MYIDEWIEQKDNNQDIIKSIRENPDETFEVLVHYHVNCRKYKRKYEQIKVELKCSWLVIAAAVLFVLCVSLSEGLL